jgi:DNA-binding NarL/FixJ family response regulator
LGIQISWLLARERGLRMPCDGVLRILIADDHHIVLLGLRALLQSHDKWEVCGEATDGRQAVEKCEQLKPDLVILDICMPKLNGLDAARQILQHDSDQRIMILTNVESEQVIRDCLQAGIRGFVLKSDATADIVLAVEALQHRKTFFTSRVADLVLGGYLQNRYIAPGAADVPRLSPREREVVQLISEGKTNKEVASILDMSAKTAETHRTNVLRKLKLHSIAELVLYAVRNNIVHAQLPTPSLTNVKPACLDTAGFFQPGRQAFN